MTHCCENHRRIPLCNRHARPLPTGEWKMIGSKTQCFRRSDAMRTTTAYRDSAAVFGCNRGGKLSMPDAVLAILIQASERQ
jgi:hypothetical protein